MSDPTSSLLDQITVSVPCHESWDAMRGDAFTRHCASCKLAVHNVSAMPRERAEGLIQQHTVQDAGRVCVRLYRRPDGTVVTGDCPTVAARLRRRTRVLVAAVVALVGLGGAAGAVATSSSEARLEFGEPESQPMRTLRRILPAAWLPPPPIQVEMGIMCPPGDMPVPDLPPAQPDSGDATGG